MKNLFLFIFLVLILTSFVNAKMLYGNKELPKLNAATICGSNEFVFAIDFETQEISCMLNNLINSSFNQSLADSLYLKLDASNDPLTGDLTTLDLIPAVGGDKDVGTSLNAYNNVYGKTVHAQTALNLASAIIVGNLIPQTDNNRAIGEDVTPKRWSQLHLGTGTSTIKGDVKINIDNTKLYFGANDDGSIDFGGSLLNFECGNFWCNFKDDVLLQNEMFIKADPTFEVARLHLLTSGGGLSAQWNYAGQQNQMAMEVTNNAGNQWVFGKFFAGGRDWDHPSQPQPYFYIQSDADPNQNNSLYGSLHHQNDSFVLNSGNGSIVLNASSYAIENVYYDTIFNESKTATQGDITNLHTCLDRTFYNITEVTGMNAMITNFTFDNVESFRNIVFCHQYTGTHDLHMSVWNNNLNQFVFLNDVGNTDVQNCNYKSIGGNDDALINASGSVKVEIIHPQSGNVNHLEIIDCLRLER